jgi:hypothetical protein
MFDKAIVGEEKRNKHGKIMEEASEEEEFDPI